MSKRGPGFGVKMMDKNIVRLSYRNDNNREATLRIPFAELLDIAPQLWNWARSELQRQKAPTNDPDVLVRHSFEINQAEVNDDMARSQVLLFLTDRFGIETGYRLDKNTAMGVGRDLQDRASRIQDADPVKH